MPTWACWQCTCASARTCCLSCGPRSAAATAATVAAPVCPAQRSSPAWRRRRCWSCWARRRTTCRRQRQARQTGAWDLPRCSCGPARRLSGRNPQLPVSPSPGNCCQLPRPAPCSQHNGGSGSDASPWNASPRFLVSLVRLLAAASAAQPGGLSPGQQQVLQEALRLVRDICARDDSGRGLTGGSGGADLVAALQAAGAVRTLLALLKALAPIQPWRRRQQPGAAAQAESAAAAAAAAGAAGPSAGAGSAGGIQVAELAPQLAAEAAGLPSAPPYPGYRSDLLAALANAAHARPAVQASTCWRCKPGLPGGAWREGSTALPRCALAGRRLARPCSVRTAPCSLPPAPQAEVGSLGGVELVLAQCQVDGESPLAREWALWGVRNLCEGNPAAQVRGLRCAGRGRLACSAGVDKAAQRQLVISGPLRLRAHPWLLLLVTRSHTGGHSSVEAVHHGGERGGAAAGGQAGPGREHGCVRSGCSLVAQICCLGTHTVDRGACLRGSPPNPALNLPPATSITCRQAASHKARAAARRRGSSGGTSSPSQQLTPLLAITRLASLCQLVCNAHAPL